MLLYVKRRVVEELRMKRIATKLTDLTMFEGSVFNISDLILTDYCVHLCPAFGLKIRRY